MLGLGETATLGAFLAQDLLLFVLFFDLMLVPFWFLIGAFGGENRDRRDDQDDRLHAGRLAADAGGRDRHRDPRLRPGRAAELLARRPARPHALGTGSQEWIFLLLRRRLPDQDAGGPRPRLAARRLPGRAAAGAGAARGGALEGRRLRLPAGRAAALPPGHRPVPGADPADRRRQHPLRLGDGVHADQRAPDRRLLLDRPARLHHASGSSPCAPTAPTARCFRWSTTASWWRRSS